MMKLNCCTGLLLGALVLAGCGAQQADYSKVELLDVRGTVTLDGIPLNNAVVTFEAPDTGSFSYAMTDAEGRFKLQLDSEMSGATPGEKIVRISTARKILGLNSDDEAGEPSEEGDGGESIDAASSGEELLPAVYHQDSALRVSVSESNTDFQFDLTSTGDEIAQVGGDS